MSDWKAPAPVIHRLGAVKGLWSTSTELVDLQWAAIWMVPDKLGRTPHWPFKRDDVIDRLNEWLGSLCSDFKFVPDPNVSREHYAWMQMRDHNQAFAVAMLGRMVAQTLMDEAITKENDR